MSYNFNYKRKSSQLVSLCAVSCELDTAHKETPLYDYLYIYIAQLGANLGDDRIQELKEPIFCLDNQRCDQKAHEETLKYLERGYKCFIWPEGSERFKDTNDLRKLKVPYEKIANMITSNVHQGMMGILKMKMIRV